MILYAMESLFDVVVCEPVTLDTESDRSVFVSWVRGLSAREVVLQRLGDFEEEVRAADRWNTRCCWPVGLRTTAVAEVGENGVDRPSTYRCTACSKGSHLPLCTAAFTAFRSRVVGCVRPQESLHVAR